MRLFNHYYDNKLHKVIHSDFFEYELSVWLHTVGHSLISIFVPILLLTFGYSISTVILYYVIFNLFDVPLNFVARQSVLRFGARITIIIATCSTIAYFILFRHLHAGAFALLFGLAFLDALYDTFYWVSHMYLFYESTRVGAADAGKSTGLLNSIRSFAGMMGPAIGALVLLIDGKYALLTACVAFFVLSIVPLLYMRHTKDKPQRTHLSIGAFFADRRERKNYLHMFFSSAASVVESTIWPMFIFSVVGTLHSIALVAVIASVGKIVFSYTTGSLSRANGNALILIGSIATIGVWLVRLFAPIPPVYYSTIVIAGFFSIMIGIPIDTALTTRAQQINTLSASTMRNAVSMSAYFSVFVILAFLVSIFKTSFIIAILCLVFLILANRFILIGDNEKNAADAKQV